MSLLSLAGVEVLLLALIIGGAARLVRLAFLGLALLLILIVFAVAFYFDAREDEER